MIRRVAIALIVCTCAAAPAAAQGFGKLKGKGRSGPVTSGSAAPAGASASGVRQFGSWMDDASVLTTGHAWTALSFGHYRTSWTRQTDLPIVDAGVGIARRLQVGLTVPYYRVSVIGSPDAARGVGDVYVNAKYVVIDPSQDGRRFGIAVSPVVELLDDDTTSSGRFAWGAPVSLEYRADRFRVFGSTGYFSRGAVFASTALELPLRDRLVVTGALSTTRATNDDALADALQLPKSRADVTAVAAYFVTSSIAAFAGTGRSLSGGDSATTFMATAGLSWTFAPQIVR